VVYWFVGLLGALENQFGPLPETLVGEAITVQDLIERLTILVQGKDLGKRRQAARPWWEILRTDPTPTMMEDLLIKALRLNSRLFPIGSPSDTPPINVNGCDLPPIHLPD